MLLHPVQRPGWPWTCALARRQMCLSLNLPRAWGGFQPWRNAPTSHPASQLICGIQGWGAFPHVLTPAGKPRMGEWPPYPSPAQTAGWDLGLVSGGAIDTASRDITWLADRLPLGRLSGNQYFSSLLRGGEKEPEHCGILEALIIWEKYTTIQFGAGGERASWLVVLSFSLLHKSQFASVKNPLNRYMVSFCAGRKACP